MSTTFKLMSDIQEESDIALRFRTPWAAEGEGCTVRFAFPEVLLPHLKDVELIGDNGETITVGQLHDSVESVDFLHETVSPLNHLAFGTHDARDPDKFLRRR